MPVPLFFQSLLLDTNLTLHFLTQAQFLLDQCFQAILIFLKITTQPHCSTPRIYLQTEVTRRYFDQVHAFSHRCASLPTRFTIPREENLLLFSNLLNARYSKKLKEHLTTHKLHLLSINFPVVFPPVLRWLLLKKGGTLELLIVYFIKDTALQTCRDVSCKYIANVHCKICGMCAMPLYFSSMQ